jgi:hypothetical protein
MLCSMTAWREQPAAGERAIFEGREHASASSSTREGLARIQAEYREMPGLRLTCEQVSRLCGVELTACEHMLEALVSTHHLERAPDGRYGLPVAQTSRRTLAGAPIAASRQRAG